VEHAQGRLVPTEVGTGHGPRALVLPLLREVVAAERKVASALLFSLDAIQHILGRRLPRHGQGYFRGELESQVRFAVHPKLAAGQPTPENVPADTPVCGHEAQVVAGNFQASRVVGEAEAYEAALHIV
jgi:hypothetical protein